MRWHCLGLTSLLGCMYHPGSFHDRTGDWPATRTTSGCLDVAIARRDVADIPGAVIQYDIGNRCDRRVTVDLGAVRAVGRDAAAREIPLVAYDPRRELRAHTLAALWSGAAQVAYQHGDAAIETICIDVGGIESATPRSERWTCFGKVSP